jgi:uncharacterized protein (TIGR03663 family)
MALETMPHAPERSVFDRAFDLSRVNLEVVAYSVLIALSIVAHLWGLGAMAMHHDESIHAWASWKLYTGEGSFTCAGHNPEAGIERISQTYCYDPVYHGPSLYFLTLFSFFLFGDGDAQARLPMALAGIGLAASCWWLRPYLGRRGALIAAVLLSFAPSLLYYTRFARHDGLMVLWELWLLIGMMRYLDTGKAGYLYLLATALALAIGTHELYYIVFFIFGILLLTRIIYETPLARFLNIGFGVLLALAGLFIAINPPLPVGEGLYLGEKMFLVAATVLLTWLASRVWSPEPVVIPRFVHLWRHERSTLWIALTILVSLYVVMYTTFFAYPRGAIDGLYQGLAYWLGSQQEYARGDQPWYYYLMQLALYEPLGIACGLGAAVYLFTRRRPAPAAENVLEVSTAPAIEAPPETPAEAAPVEETSGSVKRRRRKKRANADETVPLPDAAATDAPPAPAAQPAAAPADPLTRVPTGNLFPLLLVVWYFSSVVIFSWAGEKMPWLTVHMSLPGNLLAAWVLWRLLKLLPPLRRSTSAEQSATNGDTDAQPVAAWRMLLVPPALIVLLVALSVALWRLRADAAGQEGQIQLLQGLIPLAIVGLLLYALLTLAQQIGGRVLLALAGLTLAGLTGAYMIRASWLTVYTHPDVPIELMVYTQTAPDVPRYIDEIRELAINQTRNHRSAEDVTGGLSMPIILSSGAESLAWPVQWYLRDFQRLSWMEGETLRNATRQTFEVTLPNGSTGLAPVLMLASPHVSAETRQVLEQNYVQPYGETGVFNWWFPEGDKCSPQSPGYKRFYFNSVTSYSQISEPPPEGCVAENLAPEQAEQRTNEIFAMVEPPWQPLIWPFLPQNWEPMRNFLLFRDLPDPLTPGSRNMQVWLRADLMNGAAPPTGGGDTGGPLRLLAERAFGEAGSLAAPTGITVDSEGMAYVADTLNHRIQVYNRWGEFERSIGGQGSGEGQFNEPRGVAVDSAGNLYVADTWNARVVKIAPDGEWLATWGSGDTDMGGGRMATINETPEDNRDNPLGFFGPRGIAVDSAGNVYVADTGNKRIVMTDNEGEFIYQWGEAGSAPGSFNEPTGIAIDEANDLIYVADTWNSRVQAFERDAQGQANPIPVATWGVAGWMSNTYDDPSLAVGPQGRVYVSVPTRQQVAALSSASGQPVLRWGGAGEGLAALNAPSGIAFDEEGRVYVVDRERGRVLRFDLPRIADETQQMGSSAPNAPR